jgi:Tfp pilus assembly protein PilE
MKTNRRIQCAALIALAAIFAGCGESRKDREARERARLEQEQQAERDAAKANKAITDMNRKMFGRMNASSPGATTTTTTTTAPAQPPPPNSPKP